MELLTLATTALTLATPYLIKTGEKLAENVGEEIWNLIKKPFSSQSGELLINTPNSESDIEVLKNALLIKLTEDSAFAGNLKSLVEKGQAELNNNAQQIINEGNIEKQINIQNNSGSIQM